MLRRRGGLVAARVKGLPFVRRDEFRKADYLAMINNALTWMDRHQRVITALAAREVRTRYGNGWLGFGWTLLTPAAWIGLLVLTFDFMGRSLPIHTDSISFILSGVIPYLVFRSSVSAINRTRGMYRVLSPLSIITRSHVSVALAALELMTALLLYTLVAGLNRVLTGHLEVASSAVILGALFMAWLFGFSLGSVFDELSVLHPAFSRLVPVLLRPFFLISGVIFSANEVPLKFLPWIDWNPLLHSIEWLREGMFASYGSQALDVSYLGLANLVLLCAAFLMRRLGRRR
jgi:capsular polysaccharide transport system permease protein